MNPLTERYPDLLGEDADPALTRLVADLDAVCAPHPLPPRRDAVIARTIEEEITMHGTIAIAPALGRAGSVPRAVRTPRRIAWAAVAVAAALPFLLLIALLIMRGRVPSATPQPGTHTQLPSGRTVIAPAPGPSQAISARPGTWTMTGSMHQARAFQTTTLLPDGLVLVAGGADSNGLLDSAELYNPRTGAWTLTGAMHTAAGARGATLLPSGLVLVDGGFDGNTWITDAELYHPRTGTWTVTGSLHDPRGYQTGQTATLLGNGKVLVVGGCPTGVCSSVLASAELYNPQTGIWTLTGSLHQSRAWQPATLLASGLVLVAGGSRSFDGSTSLASVELYHP